VYRVNESGAQRTARAGDRRWTSGVVARREAAEEIPWSVRVQHRCNIDGRPLDQSPSEVGRLGHVALVVKSFT